MNKNLDENSCKANNQTWGALTYSSKGYKIKSASLEWNVLIMLCYILGTRLCACTEQEGEYILGTRLCACTE